VVGAIVLRLPEIARDPKLPNVRDDEDVAKSEKLLALSETISIDETESIRFSKKCRIKDSRGASSCCDEQEDEKDA